MDRFTYQVYSHSLENNLLQANDKIIISLSGGIDSMSLFCLLESFREKMPLELHLVHFHHGLREESDQEEYFIRELAENREIPLTVIKNNQLKNVSNLQDRARKWRYEQLHEVLTRLSFQKIALGHHLNDVMETMIWKMTRGCSLFALNSIQAQSGVYVRPLLHLQKEELKSYLIGKGQTWCEDVSNTKDDYTRNLIRNQIMPLLMQCSGGQLAEKMRGLSQDAQLLNSQFHSSVSEQEYQGETLAFQQIQQRPTLFAKELIHQFLLHHGQNEITRVNIDRIFTLVTKGQGNWKIQLKKGCHVLGKYKRLYFIEESNKETR